jgi:dsRNA-specific ribonuclease
VENLTDREEQPTEERLMLLWELAERLGVDLGDDADAHLRVLHMALTTPAWTVTYPGAPNNTTLEFYGDTIWNMAVTELIVTTYPRQKYAESVEGYRIRLVAGTLQTTIATSIGLRALTLIPEGYEPRAYGKKIYTTDVLIGSALEAFVGAVATWDEHGAVALVKKLVEPSFLKMEPLQVNSVRDRDTIFFGLSREQLVGYVRLKLSITREICREPGPLKLRGIHDVRERAMSDRAMASIARRLAYATYEHTDSSAFARLLAMAGKGKKLNPLIEGAVRMLIGDLILKISSERALVVAKRHSLSDAEVLLTTRLNGQGPPDFLCFPHGGGEERNIRIECWIDGRLMGKAISKTHEEARAKAAEAALNNPALEEVLDDY